LRPRRRFAWVWVAFGVSLLAFSGFAAWHASRRAAVFYVYRLPSGIPFIAENPEHPRLRKLWDQERLTEIVKDKQDDVSELLSLAQWSAQLFPASTPFPDYPPWDGVTILQWIRTGRTGGFCAQYAFLFGQAAQHEGFLVRYVGLATRDLRAGHFLPEVFVPSAGRWIAFEPQFGDYYVDSRGKPLGVFELHRAAAGMSGAPSVRYARQARPIEAERLALFYHFKFHLRNNFLSVPVYYLLRSHPEGTEYVFEPWVLRWVDHYTEKVAESVPAIASRNPDDFLRGADLSKAEAVSCPTLPALLEVLKRAPPLRVYRVQAPGSVLRRFVESLLPPAVPFKPLTS
jgi:hypothetical protein